LRIPRSFRIAGSSPPAPGILFSRPRLASIALVLFLLGAALLIQAVGSVSTVSADGNTNCVASKDCKVDNKNGHDGKNGDSKNGHDGKNGDDKDGHDGKNGDDKKDEHGRKDDDKKVDDKKDMPKHDGGTDGIIRPNTPIAPNIATSPNTPITPATSITPPKAGDGGLAGSSIGDTLGLAGALVALGTAGAGFVAFRRTRGS
jgi:uncharacterized low-complexity protein